MSFREHVYRVVRTIPSGRVMGYGHVASVLGDVHLARQVGYAMAALPGDTDVPWHRVIRSSGHLALQGDPSRGMIQRARLEGEGIRLVGDRVAMDVYGWSP